MSLATFERASAHHRSVAGEQADESVNHESVERGTEESGDDADDQTDASRDEDAHHLEGVAARGSHVGGNDAADAADEEGDQRGNDSAEIHCFRPCSR